MIDIGAIEEAVNQVRSINVAPLHIHVRSETYRQWVRDIWPREM